jgi:hypothetical protein
MCNKVPSAIEAWPRPNVGGTKGHLGERPCRVIMTVNGEMIMFATNARDPPP